MSTPPGPRRALLPAVSDPADLNPSAAEPPAPPPGAAASAGVAGSAAPAASAGPGLSAAAAAPAASPAWAWPVAAAVLAVASAAGLGLAWQASQRLSEVEKQLVRRQDESQHLATEANMLARQAQDAARDATAKAALLEARLAEVALQRTQVEELMQSMSRSRDENVLADVEAAIRVALQQSAITGSSEPLVTALRHADERLSRYNLPRLERVRRAVLRDLDRVRAVGAADIAVLTLRLDEVVRLVDDLPLLATGEARRPGSVRDKAAAPSQAPVAAPDAAASEPADAPWWRALWQGFGAPVWAETQALVRVTRIDDPAPLLLSPSQAFFVRENLKLRLLNARLALLSRQFETAQADLRDASTAIDKYFDPASRRTGAAAELLRQVAQQSRQVSVPRPDETLAVLAAAAAGR